MNLCLNVAQVGLYLNEAFKANPKRLRMFSPDGMSHICLEDDSLISLQS